MVDVSLDGAHADAARWKDKCLEALDANERFAGRAKGRVDDLARLLGRVARAIPSHKDNAGFIKDLTRLSQALSGRPFDDDLNRDIRAGYEHLLEVIAAHESEQTRLLGALGEAVVELEKLPVSWLLKRRLKRFRKSLNGKNQALPSQLVTELKDVHKAALDTLGNSCQEREPESGGATGLVEPQIPMDVDQGSREQPDNVRQRREAPPVTLQQQPADWNAVQRILARLLERIEAVRESTESLQSLRRQIDAGVSEQSLLPVLEQMRDLFDASLDGMQGEYRLFLDAVDRRLGGLLSSLDSVQSRALIGRDRRQAFSRGIENGFAEIRAQAQAADNLGTLKLSIDRQLQHLGRTLAEYCKSGDEDSEDSEAQLKTLRNRLADLESESQSARRQMEQQRWLAHTDTLTGLPNRRALDERLEHDFAQWQRYATPLSIAMLDIDHFKRVNDAHGHAGGDRALSCIGRLIKQRIRQVDFAARFGGEEFVILMPNTALGPATEMLEQLRGCIEASSFSHQGQEVRFTSSFGLTEVRTGDESGLALERADGALYSAKQAGRNQVCSA